MLVNIYKADGTAMLKGDVPLTDLAPERGQRRGIKGQIKLKGYAVLSDPPRVLYPAAPRTKRERFRDWFRSQRISWKDETEPSCSMFVGLPNIVTPSSSTYTAHYSPRLGVFRAADCRMHQRSVSQSFDLLTTANIWLKNAGEYSRLAMKVERNRYLINAMTDLELSRRGFKPPLP